MKDKLSSFLSKIKNRFFVRRVALVLFLAAATVVIVVFASLAKKEIADIPVSEPVCDEPLKEVFEEVEAERKEDKEEPETPDAVGEEENDRASDEKEYIPVGDI